MTTLTEVTSYRAAIWTRADGQGAIVLTSREDAHHPDEELLRLAGEEAVRSGIVGADEHQISHDDLARGLEIGEWVE